MKTHRFLFLSCIIFLFFTISAEATSNKNGTIIAVGIDLSHILLETRSRSTVRVAASLINGATSLTDEIVDISDFSTIALPDIDGSNKSWWHLFQEAHQYENAQCTNRTTGFSFNNNDTFALEEKLTYLFKRIKYTTSINYGYQKGKYFAVVAESKYDQDLRSLAKAAAKRAGFAETLVIGRNIASTMICPDKNNIEDENVYLEFHLEENSLDIAIVLKDEDGIFELLANKRLNYTTVNGSDVIPMLSSTLDELVQNAEIPDDTIINQVIITSANASHHRATIQHLQASLKRHLKANNLISCGDSAANDDSNIPHEHRITYGAAKYSRSIAREQLEGDHMICCVELSPLHYGIAVAGGLMHPIIRRHSIEDGPKSAVFTAILPQQQQQSIEIAVYRGMRLQAAFNAHVGSLHIKNEGSLSQLNITIQVDHSTDELALSVQDLTTGHSFASKFINDFKIMAAEVEQYEKNWNPEQFDLNRLLDQQLKDNVELVVSKYTSTAIDTLRERLFKKVRYTFSPGWRKQQVNDLLGRSNSMLIPITEKKVHSSPLN
ncbi:hypothetical protein V8B55DRAFT_1490437 [Mucor lusitanicus]